MYGYGERYYPTLFIPPLGMHVLPRGRIDQHRLAIEALGGLTLLFFITFITSYIVAHCMFNSSSQFKEPGKYTCILYD